MERTEHKMCEFSPNEPDWTRLNPDSRKMGALYSHSHRKWWAVLEQSSFHSFSILLRRGGDILSSGKTPVYFLRIIIKQTNDGGKKFN
jgi:hypothetical protein